MKRLIFNLLILISAVGYAQEYGTIAGKLGDKEMNNEPLPFANVQIKNTTKGTTSDFDGLYQIENVEVGTYTLVFSFIGYETVEVPNVVVTANKVTEVNTSLGASAAALDEIVIKTVARRDSEVALLLDQKEAVDIKESIGSVELAKMGVSDAATATTKISGVTSSEASGDVYVRGLGDRYLYTTMNGLPIPSDDIERKNISLDLFPTRVVSSVGISKTYSSMHSADQVSGSVDIVSRGLNGSEELGFGTRVGFNTNAMEQNGEFMRSAGMEDINFGFYSSELSTEDALTQQRWDPETQGVPLDFQYNFNIGKKFGEKFKAFLTATHKNEYDYRTGVFQQFEENQIKARFSDATRYRKQISTSALVNLDYNFNENNSLRAVSYLINRVSDEVNEFGRNGEGLVMEEDDHDRSLSQFIRDQNIRQTRLWVNQLIGKHQIGERNNIDWAVGYNMVNADEPNRIRNEINFKEDLVEFGRTGGYQQRKSYQNIEDKELNAILKNEFLVFEKDTVSSLKIAVGGNYRNKTRDFESKFYGVNGDLNPSSIDNISGTITQENINNGSLTTTTRKADVYEGILNSGAGFAAVNYAFNKFNFNAGARYQRDEIDVDWDVNNFLETANRPSSVIKEYSNIYPSLNIKFALKDNQNLRLAASKTITLPEFKEIAPFEYVEPGGQVVKGNEELEASNAYNIDLKWELFPTNAELISATGFYKIIKDPISKILEPGSAGNLTYENAGDEATVYGIELDANIGIVKNEKDEGITLDGGLNFTRMWHNQDLKDVYNEDGVLTKTYKYNFKDETGLQGASEYIVNATLNFSTNNENEFNANLSANYASDNLFAVGSPTQVTIKDEFYADEIIEKGFVTLNAVLSKQINENLSINFRANNILNPEIERTQNVRPQQGIERTETVSSYTRGIDLSLGLSYKF
ncbi:TonB-dependent receptor [Mesonia sp. K7]|uniref:TonB-dependent receptor n=1 Tax=Mesonia sp. K7 TaxID=2218606 RepID=UPI0018F253DA|nr:TonB-dependent receptor [Mesonia sp. K7]